MKIRNIFSFYFALTVIVMLSNARCSLDPNDIYHRFYESMDLSTPSPIAISDPNNFSFIHITDIHVVNENNRHLSALSSRLTSSDSFVIASGDLTENGKREDYNAYRSIMNSLGLPYYSALGNHDLWNNGWDAYKAVLGPSVYSTRAGNVRIIVLDSGDDTLGPDQYQWLKDQLRRKTESHCIVVSHYNFFSPNMLQTSQSTNMEEVYGMMRMFEQYNVDYVLMGHSHMYEHRSVHGVSYLVGSALKEYTANEQKQFLRITVSNGHMSHNRISLY